MCHYRPPGPAPRAVFGTVFTVRLAPLSASSQTTHLRSGLRPSLRAPLPRRLQVAKPRGAVADRGSVIQWISNGASDGSQGPDISAIPGIAIEQMEVLRDGAAAQYGSDAIAGVINFRLKDNREGVSLEAKYGVYDEDSDEDLFSVAANFGLPLTDRGFANFSIEYGASPLPRTAAYSTGTRRN